jgi:uncharacterized protein (TIGR00645 family)
MNLEQRFEQGLFASRWLMAPFYAGLCLSLGLLLFSFCKELAYYLGKLPNITSEETILACLSLIDLSLAGNLVLIVIFSGYENFVSKIDAKSGGDQFEWRGNVDFSALKLKLIASIVAISGIHLLKVFMNIKKYTPEDIQWMVIIHVVFVTSGVLLAVMDWIGARAKKSR